VALSREPPSTRFDRAVALLLIGATVVTPVAIAAACAVSWTTLPGSFKMAGST
jgi:hypothetical protein